MEETKNMLRKLIQAYQAQPVDSQLQTELLARFATEQERFRKRQHKRRQLTVLASLLVGLLLALNLVLFQPHVRAWAEEVPLLGSFVKVTRAKLFQQIDPQKAITVNVPKINAQNPNTIALNQKYLAEGQAAYQKARQEFGETNGHLNITGDYQTLVDDARFLVIQRTMTRTAADSHTELQYDVIDKKRNVVLSLPLLFKDQRYLAVLDHEITRQMQAQMKADPQKKYWTQQDVADQLTDSLTLMTPQREFYLNSAHQLVIVFPQYAIAPGYMGTPEFVIPQKVLKSLLVDPTYLSGPAK